MADKCCPDSCCDSKNCTPCKGCDCCCCCCATYVEGKKCDCSPSAPCSTQA